MTLRIITQRLCDGCGKDDSQVEIVQTVRIVNEIFHLCYGCKERGLVICRDCRDAHQAGACRYQQVMDAARRCRKFSAHEPPEPPLASSPALR